ncbi:hypothetical protein EDB84DRAFT_1488313, partial [Lactarius hengduanensis]
MTPPRPPFSCKGGAGKGARERSAPLTFPLRPRSRKTGRERGPRGTRPPLCAPPPFARERGAARDAGPKGWGLASHPVRLPVRAQMRRGKGRERESTRDSPPPCTRLRERGIAWEAPLSAACPRFGAEAREPGVAPPLSAQARRAKTGRRTGKGVRKQPHAPLRAHLCAERRTGAAHKPCGGALR